MVRAEPSTRAAICHAGRHAAKGVFDYREAARRKFPRSVALSTHPYSQFVCRPTLPGNMRPHSKKAIVEAPAESATVAQFDLHEEQHGPLGVREKECAHRSAV
jgi:hypothetical protein